MRNGHSVRARKENNPPNRRRTRTRAAPIDATRAWDAAGVLETMLEPGIELVHTKRMGWLLRRLDWVGPDTRPRMSWVEIDSAPDGQLGALLLRHQERKASRS